MSKIFFDFRKVSCRYKVFYTICWWVQQGLKTVMILVPVLETVTNNRNNALTVVSGKRFRPISILVTAC